MVKPDGVERRLVGAIILSAEAAGHEFIRGYRKRLSPQRARMLYREHADQPWFEDNITYICSGDIVALKFSGPRDDALVKELRSTYKLDFRRNTIHCSDDRMAEQREEMILFL